MRRWRRRARAGAPVRALAAALFIALELVTAAAALLVFVLLPMAERAADDLAG
jgi:hypothetical protein